MNAPIRVLFITRLDAGLRTGGVQLQIASTRSALTELGVEVCLCNPWTNQLNDVDICHLFTVSPELSAYAKAAVQANVPVVVSPIVNVTSPKWVFRLKSQVLSRLPGVYTELRQLRSILQDACVILPLTVGERSLLEATMRVPAEKMVVVPNGIHARFGVASHSDFVSRFGFRPDVLFVGRIDRNKNLIGLIKALEGTGLRLAVVGFPFVNEMDVYRELLRRLGPNVVYVGGLDYDDPLLASAFAAARVFCLPSYKEVMPLTVLEAIAAGSRVVLTRNSAMASFLGDSVRYVSPKNISEIRRTIIAAYDSPPPVEMRRRLLAEGSWKRVGSEILRVYERILQARKSG